MGNVRPLKGTLSCCQSAQASLRLDIQFGKGKKNAEHFVPAEKKKLARPDIGAQHSLQWAGRSSRSAAARLRRAKQSLGALGTVYVGAILTDTDLWPCNTSFAV